MKPASPLACCKPRDERPVPTVFKQQYTTENGKVKMTMPVSPMHYIVNANYYANDMRRPGGAWDYSVPHVDRAIVNPISTNGTVREVYVHEHPAHYYQHQHHQQQRRVITPSSSIVHGHENNKRQESTPIPGQTSAPPVVNTKPTPCKEETPMIEVTKVEELLAKLDKKLDALEAICRRNEAEVGKVYELIMELPKSLVPAEPTIAANATFSDKHFAAISTDLDVDEAKAEDVVSSRASSSLSIASSSKRSVEAAPEPNPKPAGVPIKPAAEEQKVQVKPKVAPRVAKSLPSAPSGKSANVTAAAVPEPRAASLSAPAVAPDKERKAAVERLSERKARDVPRRPKVLEISSGRAKEPEAVARVTRQTIVPITTRTKAKQPPKPTSPKPLPLPHAIEYTKPVPVQEQKREVEKPSQETLWPAIGGPKVERTETNSSIDVRSSLALQNAPPLQTIATLEEDIPQEVEAPGFMALDNGANVSDVDVEQEQLPANSDLSVVGSAGTPSPEQGTLGGANVAGLSKDQAKEWLKRCQEELLLLQAESAANAMDAAEPPQPAVEYPDLSEGSGSFGDVVVLKTRDFEDAVDDFDAVQ